MSAALWTCICTLCLHSCDFVKSGSILGIYVRTFGHLRRCRRLDVYARARIQYRLGAYRKLGACETRFIAFATLATF